MKTQNVEAEIIFSETQRFRQWWIWLVIGVANALFLIGVVKQVIFGRPFGSEPMSNTMLLACSTLMMLILVLFLTTRLETRIQTDGVYERFFPFQFRFKVYPLDSISTIYVREYAAISEYGGWGMRLGIRGNGPAYTISGNQGLQLEFKSGKRLLIGTKQPDELKMAVGRLRST